MGAANEKTTREFWDATHLAKPRARLPSGLVTGTGNLLRLLRQNVKADTRVLEIGFAPGKLLAYVAARLHASVAGLDYSQTGIDHARALFQALGLEADMRCENMFETTFEPGSFDFVYSAGVVEHFEDPRAVIRLHVELTKPGGTALLLIPDYGGIYGRLQARFDPDNLAIHNLRMMSVEAFGALAPADLAQRIDCTRVGRLSPWQVSFDRRWPRPLALATNLTLNAIGLLQPMDIGPLCPMLALRVVRKSG